MVGIVIPQLLMDNVFLVMRRGQPGGRAQQVEAKMIPFPG